MTKKEKILEIVGDNRIKDDTKFMNRAIRKDSEWLDRLYNFFKKDINEHPAECRNFCIALLNR